MIFDPRLCPDAVEVDVESSYCDSRVAPFGLDLLHEWTGGRDCMGRKDGARIVIESTVYGADGVTPIGVERLRIRPELLGLSDLPDGSQVLFDAKSIKGERRVRASMRAGVRKRWKCAQQNEAVRLAVPGYFNDRRRYCPPARAVRILSAEFRRRGYGSFDEAYRSLGSEYRGTLALAS